MNFSFRRLCAQSFPCYFYFPQVVFFIPQNIEAHQVYWRTRIWCCVVGAGVLETQLEACSVARPLQRPVAALLWFGAGVVRKLPLFFRHVQDQ